MPELLEFSLIYFKQDPTKNHVCDVGAFGKTEIYCSSALAYIGSSSRGVKYNLNVRITVRTSYLVKYITSSFCPMNLPNAILVNPI